MSLGIVIKGPEGLVLAAESRLTVTVQLPQGQPLLHVNFDHATKLLSFGVPHNFVGAVTYGLAALGQQMPRTAASFLPEFEAGLPGQRLPVADFAQRLSDFFMQQWQVHMPPSSNGPEMVFVVGGFDTGAAYGRVFQFSIPNAPAPVEVNPDPEFGITWGGQHEIVDRLLKGYDPQLPNVVAQALNLQPPQVAVLEQALSLLNLPIPITALALQDCVDLAIFILRTTIAAQKLAVMIRGVGGPIDVATITRQNGLTFVQRKQIVGEPGQPMWPRSTEEQAK